MSFQFSACSGLLKSKYLKRDSPYGIISFEILGDNDFHFVTGMASPRGFEPLLQP